MTASRSRRVSVASLALVVALLAGCAASTTPSGGASPSSPATPDVTPTERGTATSAPSETTAAPTDGLGPFACDFPVESHGTTARAQLTDVRIGEHGGYDRVVFEFANGVPPFTISLATPPFYQDGSGFPIEVEGSSHWQVRLDGGTKVSPEGGITYDGPTGFRPGFSRLVHLVEAGDFEAVSTWYVGLEAASCVRVLQLSAPWRLVIDIEH